MLEAGWAALGGDPADAALLELTSLGRQLGGTLDCDGLLRACAASALLAAAELAEARGFRRPEVALDGRDVAAAAASERFAGIEGTPRDGAFAPLSRFVEAADGWLRLHGNYVHHRAALTRVLGTEDPVAAVAAARDWEAVALEDAVVAAGGCAAAVRTRAAWEAHPQGALLTSAPLVIRGAEREARSAAGLRDAPPGMGPEAPAAGLRVLDLTRVIAGPVATRMLAALGADVLRIGHPGRPELPLHVVDGLVGKRAATLDLGARAPELHALLAGADVLLSGYRPGALDRFGLSSAALAEHYPDLVDVRLSAWGEEGPWGARRGFDSLVQAACGIADHEGVPGALPVQALDHGTGWLAAAAALRGLTRRAQGAGGSSTRLALATTGAWLLRHPVAAADTAPMDQELLRLPAQDGSTVLAARPPGTLDGIRLGWRTARTREDADPPVWG